MKIVAYQSDGRYLVQTSKEKGFVVDLNENKRYPDFNIQSILSRGYWEESKLTDEEHKAILDKIASFGEVT